MKQNPIIVALDVDSGEEARMLVARLGEHIHFYKVGMELYAAAGMPFVRELITGGKHVFLDKREKVEKVEKVTVEKVTGKGD